MILYICQNRERERERGTVRVGEREENEFVSLINYVRPFYLLPPLIVMPTSDFISFHFTQDPELERKRDRDRAIKMANKIETSIDGLYFFLADNFSLSPFLARSLVLNLFSFSSGE